MILVLAYILAFVTVAFIPNISFLFLWPFIPLIKRVKILSPILVFIFNGIFGFISVFIIAWLCSKLNIEPTLLMIIIPAGVMILNNRERTSRVKKDHSNVKYMLEQSDQSEEYNKNIDTATEYAYYVSDVVGLLFGVLYFLNNALLY